MALGSSAPEILLGIIEICFAQKFYAGTLGPSTIVGSAAFNLLIIIGVCTISLTNYKRISRHSVYIVTAVFSVFAYLWIVIVTQGISPNVISVGEAIVTVLLFPVLVGLAYLIDKVRTAGNAHSCEYAHTESFAHERTRTRTRVLACAHTQ